MRIPSFILLFFLPICIGSCAEPIAPETIRGSRFHLSNALLLSVALRINGVDAGTVPPRGSLLVVRGDLDVAEVEWELNRPEIDGIPVGDPMQEIVRFDLPGDGDSVAIDIDNVLRDEVGTPIIHYAPRIVNATPVPIALGIDMGTPEEWRTGIVLQPGESTQLLGYRRFDPGSNVRAYHPRVAYSPFLFVEKRPGNGFDFNDIESGSGALDLVIDQEPPRVKPLSSPL